MTLLSNKSKPGGLKWQQYPQTEHYSYKSKLYEDNEAKIGEKWEQIKNNLRLRNSETKN